jgi:kynurenine formamidase
MTVLDPARLIDLTEPWAPDCWPYPGHPRTQEGILQTFPRDRINTWTVTTTMHTGTHVDAPLHCTSRGDDVASIPFERLVRPGYVVDLRDFVRDWHVITPEDVGTRIPGALEPGDALILRYGWQRYAKGHAEEDAETYFNRHPGPGQALVQWMIDREVAWVGTDAPSFEHPANIYLRSRRPDLVSEMERVLEDREAFDDSTWMIAHRLLLARGQLHVDQAGGDLDAVPERRVTLAIFPWRYRGGEASVCRLIALA